jgi:hypothetical protein
MRSAVVRIALGIVALVATAGIARAQLSPLIDLGPYAPGLAINNSGQVVLQHYFYGNGTLTAFTANFTGAGINATGQVVGWADVTCVNAPYGVSPCIAVWTSGTLTISPGFESSDYTGNYGFGINNSGQIVGYWYTPDVIGEYTGALLLSNGAFSSFFFRPR